MEINTPEVATINLNGMYGEFYIVDSKVKVKYFSTFASPDSESGGGHHELLKQLSPMRERIKASKMKSLDSLLQRDLSDERIASDLIPYLLGKSANVGFFPPVLAVVMPKGFVGEEGGESIEYPINLSKDDYIKKYNGYWSLSIYPQKKDDKDVPSRLGMLSIDANKADIIVIDGQHRSNAFRYAADCFKVESIYQPFYEKVKYVSHYKSDLPVTIIWFENDNNVNVQPTDISRELFVAVNNSAKRVSESRTVLLDEVNVTSLGVNTYYRFLAENKGFNQDGMNLLTSGFDVDTQLSSAQQPKMTITNPSILSKAFIYSFFGNASYDELKERATRAKQDNNDRFKKIFGTKEYYERPEQGIYKILDAGKRKKFRNDFIEKYLPVLNLLHEKNKLVDAHYDSIKDTINWIDAEVEPTYQTIWEKVFCGGEGLYSAFIESELDSCKQNKKFIKAINSKFIELRTERIKKSDSTLKETSREYINQCYETYNTIAFHTGFLMAVDYIANNYEGTLKEHVNELIDVFEKINLSQWVIFFNDFKTEYIGDGLDPNSWPKLQKMILRLISESYDDLFTEDNESVYPEYSMVKNSIERSIIGYFDGHGEYPDSDKVSDMAETKSGDVYKVIKDLGVTPLKKSRLKKIAKQHGISFIEDNE